MEVFKALSMFEKAMTGRLRPQLDDLSFIVRAGFDGRFHQNLFYGFYPQYDLIRPALTMIFCNRVNLSGYIGWGWKEPNTHLILDKLAEYFGDLKYIHVLRHGLDIAYGKSKGQYELFGDFFEIPMPNSPHLRPKAMLQYWIKANERAVRIGQQMLGDRFLLLNWDDLCIVVKYHYYPIRWKLLGEAFIYNELRIIARKVNGPVASALDERRLMQMGEATDGFDFRNRLFD